MNELNPERQLGLTEETQETADPQNNEPTVSSGPGILIELPTPRKRSGAIEYQSKYADIACRLKAVGFTDQDLAYTLDVSVSTIHRWKNTYESFRKACDDGKRELKKRLVAKAVQQAMGYDYKESNVREVVDGKGKQIRSENSVFNKHQQGNERMLVFLLTNIDRQLGDDEWKAVSKIEVDESKNLKIVVDGKHAKEQIARLAGELADEQ